MQEIEAEELKAADHHDSTGIADFLDQLDPAKMTDAVRTVIWRDCAIYNAAATAFGERKTASIIRNIKRTTGMAPADIAGGARRGG